MMALGFASFLAGVILGVAGITGSTLHSVAQGKPDHAKQETGGSGSPGSTTSESLGGVEGAKIPKGAQRREERSVATQILKRLKIPVTSTSLNNMYEWFAREGGNWNNTAAYNPLNTTLSTPGSTTMNSVGVRVYKSWSEGIAATVRTLEGYPELIRNLSRSGFGQSAELNKWGTGTW